MPYVTPTPAEFRDLYPLFAGVADAPVLDAIGQGEGRVNETWREADRRPAVMLFAAHTLTLNGHGTSTEAQLAREGLGDFQTIESASLKVSRFARRVGPMPTELESTSYGKRFKELLRLNFAGPRVVPSGSGLPTNPGALDA